MSLATKAAGRGLHNPLSWQIKCSHVKRLDYDRILKENQVCSFAAHLGLQLLTGEWVTVQVVY